MSDGSPLGKGCGAAILLLLLNIVGLLANTFESELVEPNIPCLENRPVELVLKSSGVLFPIPGFVEGAVADRPDGLEKVAAPLPDAVLEKVEKEGAPPVLLTEPKVGTASTEPNVEPAAAVAVVPNKVPPESFDPNLCSSLDPNTGPNVD